MVPKAVMHFMVDNVKRGLSQHLIKCLYREDLFDEARGGQRGMAPFGG